MNNQMASQNLGYTCKGAFVLATACGQCVRCESAAHELPLGVTLHMWAKGTVAQRQSWAAEIRLKRDMVKQDYKELGESVAIANLPEGVTADMWRFSSLSQRQAWAQRQENTKLREALKRLVLHAKIANQVTLRECGVGVIDLGAIRQGEEALGDKT